jgi:C_GCAxxG_C_C family probable redox protein
MSHSELAASTFRAGFSCTQAVLSAFAPEMGLDRDTALRVAGAFGAGIARTGQTCGAVSGALMVLGLRYGQTQPEDRPTKEKMYEIAQEFIEEFEAREGSVLCRELLGYDVSDPQQYQVIKDRGLFTSLCPRLVEDAVEIVEQILQR